MSGACRQQAFEAMEGGWVLLAIQETTNVEPVTPAQHLQFGLLKIFYWE